MFSLFSWVIIGVLIAIIIGFIIALLVVRKRKNDEIWWLKRKFIHQYVLSFSDMSSMVYNPLIVPIISVLEVIAGEMENGKQYDEIKWEFLREKNRVINFQIKRLNETGVCKYWHFCSKSSNDCIDANSANSCVLRSDFWKAMKCFIDVHLLPAINPQKNYQVADIKLAIAIVTQMGNFVSNPEVGYYNEAYHWDSLLRESMLDWNSSTSQPSAAEEILRDLYKTRR